MGYSRNNPCARLPQSIPDLGDKQRGIALITAVIVVVLASVAAVAMLNSAGISIRRTANLQNSEQAEWYAQGLDAWVCSLLQRERQLDPGKHYDSLGDPWAQPITYLPFDRGGVSGRLVDLQGRFNLNNLGALNPKPALAQLQRLIENVPGGEDVSTADLGIAIRNWLGARAGQGAVAGPGDEIYLSLNPPYRASHRLMQSPSELLGVDGVTPQLYMALAPYITALPTTHAKININTAPLPVLLSLTANPGGDLEGFAKERVQDPLTGIQDATTRSLFNANDPALQVIDVQTSYFQLQARISVGTGRLYWYSTIYRPASGTPAVVSQSSGAY